MKLVFHLNYAMKDTLLTLIFYINIFFIGSLQAYVRGIM